MTSLDHHLKVIFLDHQCSVAADSSRTSVVISLDPQLHVTFLRHEESCHPGGGGGGSDLSLMSVDNC